MGFNNGFGFPFNILPFFVIVIFVIVISGILFTIIKGVRQWSYNNQQPRLTVIAKVVSRRLEVSHHNHTTNDHVHHSSTTYYYVTFEVESGDRMEFAVDGMQYGQLVEGDRGKLTFQGTRFLGYERQIG